MRVLLYKNRRISRVEVRLFAFVAVVVLAGVLSCAQKPLEEVVTTDANRASALPPGAEPMALAPDLPQRDENIEAAGDRIAEAITYLNQPRRDRREAALHALNQAEGAINNALGVRPEDDQALTALRMILRDLEAAKRSVQRASEVSAARQLSALNRNIDNLELRPAGDQAKGESESPSPLPSATN